MGLIVRNLTRQVARGIIDQDAMDAALGHIKGAPELQAIGATDLAIEAATENEETKKQIFKALGPHLLDTTLLASNTLLHLDHAAGRGHRPPGPVHRPALHEPGAADEAGRDHPRDRDRPGHLRDRREVRPVAGQDHRQRRGLPGLHRQPRAGADDQRGDLHPLRGRRHRGGHRHGDEARRQPSHGPAGARRLHRPRHRAVDHERALRGPGGLEVPPLSAAGEIRRGRLAGPQGRPWLLRTNRGEHPVPTR